MIIRGASLTSRMAVLFAFLVVVTACGGGGGGGGSFIPDDNELKLTLLDSEGNKTTVVTATSPAVLQVKVSGDGNKNLAVTATTDLGVIIPASGSALTDNNGIATFQIEAGVERGAGTITARATTDNGAVSGNLDFQVGENGLRMGFFDEDGTFIENQIYIEPESALAAGGNALLSVVVVTADGERVATTEEVRFNSACIGAGQSTINPENPVTTVNGEASTLYSALNCSGNEEITASLVGAGAQAFGSLSIAAATANAITFESAEPTLIVLRGTGGENRDETADVIFTVVDGAGAPLQGVTVNFELSTYVGGLSLSKTSVLSDGDGQVQVTVASGDVATVVRVLASIDDGEGNIVSTVSDLLTVTTGLPDQNSISLSVGPCSGSGGFVVEEGMRVDGVCRQLTVRMADKFNNPVVDGTSAVFTTEYGAIVGSCSTEGGACFVEWNSQEPRFPTLTGTAFVKTIYDADYSCPSHNGNQGPCPDDLGYIHGGMSTILVHAIGEESFIDSNGNGVMDEAESHLFDNLPEAYIDHNMDGIYTPSDPTCLSFPDLPRCIAGAEETFVDLNSNEVYDFNDAPAVYNGLLCPPEGDQVWCSRDLVNVRDQTLVILSDDPGFDIILVRNGSEVSGTINGGSQTAYIADTYNNPPPLGSTVKLSVDGNCELVGADSYDVPNYASTGAIGIGVTTIAKDPIDPEGGIVTVTLESSSGSNHPWSFSCEGGVDCSNVDLSPRPPECPDEEEDPAP